MFALVERVPLSSRKKKIWNTKIWPQLGSNIPHLINFQFLKWYLLCVWILFETYFIYFWQDYYYCDRKVMNNLSQSKFLIIKSLQWLLIKELFWLTILRNLRWLLSKKYKTETDNISYIYVFENIVIYTYPYTRSKHKLSNDVLYSIVCQLKFKLW